MSSIIDSPEAIQNILSISVGGISVIFAIASIVGAFRSGVLKRIRFGSIEVETGDVQIQEIQRRIQRDAAGEDGVPFEVEQLARYYSQVLSQSKISFWFSLIFASLGFAVIVVSAFLYNSSNPGVTAAQFSAGVIMDAVAGLFFVQSNRAQKSMSDFFDKLRSDRLHTESRKLCDSIENGDVKDALKVRLSLHYAGFEGRTESLVRKVLGQKGNSEEQLN